MPNEPRLKLPPDRRPVRRMLVEHLAAALDAHCHARQDRAVDAKHLDAHSAMISHSQPSDGLKRPTRLVVSARVALIPLLVLVLLRTTSPGYLAVFDEPTGQLLLAGCALVPPRRPGPQRRAHRRLAADPAQPGRSARVHGARARIEQQLSAQAAVLRNAELSATQKVVAIATVHEASWAASAGKSTPYKVNYQRLAEAAGVRRPVGQLRHQGALRTNERTVRPAPHSRSHRRRPVAIMRASHAAA